jgi:hypothetical protein
MTVIERWRATKRLADTADDRVRALAHALVFEFPSSGEPYATKAKQLADAASVASKLALKLHKLEEQLP